MSDQGKDPLDLWIDALEKPSYWQGRGYLRRPSSDAQILGYEYSAIGVLCDLFIKHAPEDMRAGARWEGDMFAYGDSELTVLEWSVFPPQVMLWLGIEKYDLMAVVLKLEHNGHFTFKDLAIFLRYARSRNFTIAKRAA